MPFAADGLTTDPSVSVPMAATHRFALTATAEPELDPQGLRSRAYGFFVSPPRPLQPLVDELERMLAHSLRLALARMTAPASRSRRTRNASCSGRAPTNASDPAVVAMRSAVSMLSLMTTGIPCSGPRKPLVLRSLSKAPAPSSASGLISRMLFSAGPRLSMASMHARYASASERALSLPDAISCCSSAILFSCHSNGGASKADEGRVLESVRSAATAAPSNPA